MQTYSPAPDILKDRVILVTGAGDGIGKAAALDFARFGATVILLGRTTKKLEKTYDAIEEAGHPQAAIYPMNLEGAAPKDYLDMATAIGEEFGRLDGIFHNAAVLGTLTPMGLYNIEEWYKVMQVNLNAPFMLTQACLNLLQQSEDASILFNSDSAGRQGKAYWGAYGVSKSGLEGMMQILAHELEGSTKIRVNSIDLGPVLTSLRMTAYPGEDHLNLTRPAQVTADLLYLMGPDGKGTHGQQLSLSRTLSNNSPQ